MTFFLGIDGGGNTPAEYAAMIRAAAKNHDWVTVVVDPEDYARVLGELDEHNGATAGSLRRNLAEVAFARTAAYDAAVSNWLASQQNDKEPPRRRALSPVQPARAISGARNSRNTGDHLACSGPLEEWPSSLSISK